MNIIGFYHVLLKNHWQEIVQEQLDCLMNSGLYENAEDITVGAVGEKLDLELLKGILPSKFKIIWLGNNIEQFEFPTLSWMKFFADETKEKSAIFYIHTKGASFDKSHERGYNGGNYWRGYMNFYNITNWRNALNEIEINGADIVGVKFRDKKSTGNPHARPHFSGNFFWTHSDYVKKLPPIDSLNKSDRIEAEFWHGSAQPKAVSMCQDWVDYNTKGIWKNPKIIMKRNIVHTLCWNVFSEVEKAVEDLYRRNDKNDFMHVLVDLGFPLEFGDIIPDDMEKQKSLNTQKLKSLAEKYGSIYFKAQNIGVSQNWSQVAKFMQITQDDILICADPDERVQSDGWIKAMCDVMRYNKKYAWISLTMPEHFPILNESNIREYKYWDTRVWEIIGNLNWAQGGMSGSLICKMGGVIPHPQRYGIYGGLESATMIEIKKNAMTWGMLPDYVVKHTDEIPLLREWKDQIIHRIKEHGQMSFEKFLQMKKNGVFGVYNPSQPRILPEP